MHVLEKGRKEGVKDVKAYNAVLKARKDQSLQYVRSKKKKKTGAFKGRREDVTEVKSLLHRLECVFCFCFGMQG